jgi:ATP/maltotriose-dependent transcriptional regulator MalT
VSTVTEDPVVAGQAALARGDWSVARAAFAEALADGANADAYDGLGWVGWWSADAELTLDNRELAFNAFLEDGRRAQAAEIAGWLAADFVEFRGDDALARSWIARARRTVDGLPEGPEHGWVSLHEAYLVHALDGDAARSLELAREGIRIGRAHGVTDLEALGLAHAGLAQVRAGLVQPGMRDLDEAVGLTTGDDLRHPVSPAWTLCLMLSACARLGDVSRAEQWCGALRAFCEKWNNRHLMGTCRTSYGWVQATSGAWQTAECELQGAIEDLSSTRRPIAAGGLARLGTLRVRQGRPEEARELFEQAAPEPEAIVGLGTLALLDGDAQGAREAAERALRRIPPAAALERLPGLELLVRAAIGTGDLDAARAAGGEVDRVAASAATPFITGRAQLVAAEIALGDAAHDDARCCAEDAIDAFTEASAPYHRAAAREVLSRALEGLGRGDRARAEADAARDAFAVLGVRRAAIAPGAGGELSARELEVLKLVAQGLSDADIAERLIVSPHTVHRHVANIRAKLRLPSRAAAVAYAAREGLL